MDNSILINNSDDEIIKILRKGKDVIVICFDNDFNEEHFYNKISDEGNIKKILIFGIKKRKKFNEKIEFIRKINKKFFYGCKEALIVIKTDIDEEVLQPIVQTKDICEKKEIQFGIGEKENIISVASEEKSTELEVVVQALKEKNLYKRYEIIYDYICDVLDEKFKNNTICKFKDGRCVLNRKWYNRGKRIMGCCESFDFNYGFITNVKLCEKLGEKGCTAKCLGCKLFTCDYLKKHGIRFTLEEIPVALAFFTKKQRETLRISFFVEKEEVLKRLV